VPIVNRDVRRSTRRWHTDSRVLLLQQLLLRCPVKLHADEQMLEWAVLLKAVSISIIVTSLCI